MSSEKRYDLRGLARSNLHVHTQNSLCAKEGMTMENILEEADRCGLDAIAITDHHNSADFPVLQNNADLKARADRQGARVRVLYGAELSAYGVGLYLDSPEVNRALDYRLYTCNHYHLDFWEHPEEKTPRAYVEHTLRILRQLFRSGRADCVAHPFIGRFIRCFEDRTLVTRAITDQELGDIMALADAHGVAWELNTGALLSDPAFARRYFRMGKEVGVRFHLGTDAHRIDQIDTRPLLERLQAILEGE